MEAKKECLVEKKGSLVEQKEYLVEKKECLEVGGFTRIMAASLFYALVYTFCLYENISGITVILWSGATVAYMLYVMGAFGVKEKSGSRFYLVVMILLGISTATTGNWIIIFLNYTAFCLLLLTALLHNFQDKSESGIITLFAKMMISVFGAIALFTKPFEDTADYCCHRKRKVGALQKNIIFGLLISIPFVVIIGLCLASADAVFETMIFHPFRNIAFSLDFIPMFLMFFFAFFSSYCGMRYFGMRKITDVVRNHNEKNAVIAITFTSVMTLLYVVFCMIQIFYLFLGNMELPAGMTYAGYARQGFFQLLFVCAVNLIMVLTVKKSFQKCRVLDFLLFAISGCTFIMIASSAYRMVLYIEAYHLTFLRVLVLVSLAVLLFLMIGIVVWIQNPAFELTRYSIVTVSIIYVMFSFSHIDYFIASYNLSRMTGHPVQEDMSYITMLSTDAAPAIADYVEKYPEMKEKILDASSMEESYWDNVYWQDTDVSWYLEYYTYNSSMEHKMNIRNFNVSTYLASRYLIHM